MVAAAGELPLCVLKPYRGKRFHSCPCLCAQCKHDFFLATVWQYLEDLEPVFILWSCIVSGRDELVLPASDLIKELQCSNQSPLLLRWPPPTSSPLGNYIFVLSACGGGAEREKKKCKLNMGCKHGVSCEEEMQSTFVCNQLFKRDDTVFFLTPLLTSMSHLLHIFTTLFVQRGVSLWNS